MLCGMCRKFLNDEQGAGTIMGLLWFMLLVGITGMAVDVTDGFRNRTMLQATADASALAAAIDLPDNTAAAAATAVAYSAFNMGAEINGSVLDPADVQIGLWDQATKSLDTTSLVPDAVMVTVRRSAENGNALPVNFLRIIGLQTWNVISQAVAQRFIPGCLRDGLIAREIVDISSNNGFINEICIHGEQGVNMQSNNYFETGVNVTMPKIPEMLEIPASGMDSNIGLPPALRENHLDPRMVDHVEEIMLDMLIMQGYVMPDYINTTYTSHAAYTAATTADASLKVVEAPLEWVPTYGKFGYWTYDFANLKAGRVYHLICPEGQKDGAKATVPSGTVLNQVVIISDCPIHFGSNVYLSDVVVGVLDAGQDGPGVDYANISFAAGAQLGRPDNCAPGGGVQIFTNASVKFASTTSYDGVQIVAAGDVELGARDMGINGISVQAGGSIFMTSNNMFGLCSGSVDGLFTVDYYRLVL